MQESAFLAMNRTARSGPSFFKMQCFFNDDLHDIDKTVSTVLSL